MPAVHIGQLCRRCDINEAILTVRTEPLCQDCFHKYVTTKVVKRMETFRTRNIRFDQQRKLLLPVSLGVSSVTLLHVLDGHLQRQLEKNGRTGYALHVHYIFDHAEGNLDEDLPVHLSKLRERYPQHNYTAQSLETIFEQSNGDVGSFSRSEEAPSLLQALLRNLPSASSQADVLSVLRTRLIVAFAKSNGCEAIIWGHSTTRLAEQVLAETAKGRGFSLPWHVTDGPTPYGIPFYFPMRDLLKKELVSYTQLSIPSLTPLLDEGDLLPTQAAPSSKSTSINDLMKQYFESVEESYPSIVSNVVRTSSRLEARTSDTGLLCKLCQLPVTEKLIGTHDWSGEQGDDGDVTPEGWQLCYGCTRSVPATAVPYLP